MLWASDVSIYHDRGSKRLQHRETNTVTLDATIYRNDLSIMPKGEGFQVRCDVCAASNVGNGVSAV